MLYYAISTLHVLVCIILILVVLLQSGKGADLAGAFGGGATQTAFGSRGPASFLSKLTTAAAILFMVTSLGLSGIGGTTATKSIMDNSGAPAVPVPAAPAPKTQGKAPTPEEIKKQQEEIESRQKKAPAPAQQQPVEPAGKQAPAPDKKSSPGKSPA